MFIRLPWMGIPTLGGFAFYYPGDSRVTGVRLAPPTLDPRRYFEDMRWHMDNPDAQIPTDGEKEEKRAKSKKRREGRGRFARRYETFAGCNLAPERSRSPGARPRRR